MSVILHICPRCKTEYKRTVEFFSKRLDGLDGLYNICRRCRSAQHKIWVNTHQVQYLAYRRREYEEYGLMQSRQWRRDNLGQARASARLRYAKNGKGGLECRRQQRRDNPELWRARRRCQYERHRKQEIVAATLYAKQHSNVGRAVQARRRSSDGTWNAETVRRLFWFQDSCCQYCNVTLNMSGGRDSYHVDHMIPLARSGSNWPSNICLACAQCNLRKHAMTAEEFYHVLEAA